MSELLEKYRSYVDYCIEMHIGKILIFIKNAETVLDLRSYLDEKAAYIEVIAVTFPANEPLYKLNEQSEVTEIVPEASKGSLIKDMLSNRGIQLITSALPFEGIVIPGENYNPYKIVEQTLGIINYALPNLVQTLLIATDNGAVLPQERVLVINTALAIDALGTNTRLLFHPKNGMKIMHIL